MTLAPTWSPEIERHLENLRREVKSIFRGNTVLPNSRLNGLHLSHFTKQENLVRILSNYAAKRPATWSTTDHYLSLWLSDVSCLNDPLEGRALFSFVKYWSGQSGPKKWGNKDFSDAKKWKDLQTIVHWLQSEFTGDGLGPRDTTVRRILICSFTQDTDRIELWRAYGADGTGICLSMPLSEALARLAGYKPPVSQLFHVRYSDEEKAAAWMMLANHLEPLYQHAKALTSDSEKESLRKAVIAECEQVFHLYKHEQYQNEHEMRLIRTFDLDDPDCFARSRGPFDPGVRIDLELNRVYAYSDPFFLGGTNGKVIIGPKVQDAPRLATTLSTFMMELWGSNAPQVELSTAPYR